MPWTMHDILKATGAERVCGDGRQSFTGISIDSRTIAAGELFVAIKGKTTDGHAFLAAAAAAAETGEVGDDALDLRGQHVEPATVLAEWDPYTVSILSDGTGVIRFKDIVEGVTVHEEVDEVTGLSRLEGETVDITGMVDAFSAGGMKTELRRSRSMSARRAR